MLNIVGIFARLIAFNPKQEYFLKLIYIVFSQILNWTVVKE